MSNRPRRAVPGLTRVGALLALAGASFVAAQPPTPITGELPVPAPDPSSESGARLDDRADGSFLLAWQDSVSAADTDIETRTLADDGTFGPIVRANLFLASHQDSCALDVGEDGGLVVVWRTQGQFQAGERDLALRHGGAVATLGPEIRANSLFAADPLGEIHAVRHGDGFSVVWQDQAGGVFLNRLDPDGVSISLDVDVRGGEPASAPEAVDSAFDSTLVAYQAPVDGAERVFTKLFDGHGEPFSIEVAIAEPLAGEQREPALAGDPLGRFLVAWTEQEDAAPLPGSPHRLRYRCLGPDLVPTSFAEVARESEARILSDVRADAAPDGAFVLSWTETEISVGSRIRALELDPRCAPVAAPFDVSTSEGFRFDSDAAIGADALAFVWSADNTVLARLLRRRSIFVDGFEFGTAPWSAAFVEVAAPR